MRKETQRGDRETTKQRVENVRVTSRKKTTETRTEKTPISQGVGPQLVKGIIDIATVRRKRDSVRNNSLLTVESPVVSMGSISFKPGIRRKCFRLDPKRECLFQSRTVDGSGLARNRFSFTSNLLRAYWKKDLTSGSKTEHFLASSRNRTAAASSPIP